MRKSSEPSEEMVSAISSAGWPAASIAARTSGTGIIMPVAVSLWTTQTALMAWPVSAASAAFTAAMSTPRRQSAATVRTSMPRSSAILAQEREK